jgi:hypothetical protein
MRCYIAGPMSGLAEFNFPAFDTARDDLIARGYAVISPADLDRAGGFNETGCTGHEPLTATQKHRFARNDLGALLDVDEVWVLPGWERSTGARHEVTVAGWLGLEVREYPSGELVDPASEWSGPPNERASLLREAEQLVNGDRNATYGDPRQDFQRTATMWAAYLGVEVAPHDVAAMMALLKVSRIRWSPAKRDSWADLAGYAACGWHCAAPDPAT